MILKIGDLTPDVARAAYIAGNATVAGDVTLGEDATIWFGVVGRGDTAPISIGNRTNVQDNAVLHVHDGDPLTVGNDVAIGHAAIVHACTIGDGSLIGMGACIMNKAVIPPRSMVGAGALVPPGRTFPEGSLIVGSPARAIRTLREEELEEMKSRVAEYINLGRRFAEDARII